MQDGCGRFWRRAAHVPIGRTGVTGSALGLAHGRGGGAVPAAAEARTRLPDPVCLPARAPYRYALRFTAYRNRVPHHALRLLAETTEGTAVPPVLHVFTW